MAFGEIVFSSFCQVLFDKLSSLALGYWQRDQTNATLLDEWKGMLVKINAVLDDAEEKQLSDNRPVKLWLDDVRDLAYDMDDLLDDLEMEAAQEKSQAESNMSRGKRKRKFFSINLPRSLVSDTRVQNIKARLKTIFTEKAPLNLRENAADKSNDTNKRLPSTSLPEPQFFGREEEEAEILELLTSEAKIGDTTLSIVPIVGMGGVGKTALAQRLYNDAEVRSNFEKRAWVCVSDVFDIIGITKTILLSITGVPDNGKDLDRLQVKLKDNLSTKKFLVVLDDVWNENYVEWTALLKPFEAGAKGSKIIITTRNLSVVSLTGASPYPLKELSIDNCTSLLAFHALGERNFESHPDLERIGKELAKRCKGVPLAAKTLGGALRNKRNPDEWEETLNSKLWDLSMVGDDVLPILKLSYVHLPSYLKRCFAYCAVFPKDYEIERDKLVLLWIAEGFLDGQENKEDILKLGREHFDELVSRSFLQQSSVDTSKFSMHDLFNDLAKSIAGRTHLSIGESQSTCDKDHASLEKTRYALFIFPQYVIPKCLRGCGNMKLLRSLTLMHVGPWKGAKFSISNKLLHDLLTNLKYLRVLSLCHCDITEVPKCVGDLKHLRYLNFSYTDIERLPDSIEGLCKLQALILRGCQNLLKLPPGITKVVTLRFLDIRDTKSLKEMPLGISNLKNLTILPKFVVGLEKASQLNELKNLPHLQGELFISKLQRAEEVRDAINANLLQKRGLTNLSLHWDGCLGNLDNHEGEAQEQVLNSLRPHPNLESLSILYYGGAIFPSWLDGGSYSKVVSLCFRGCRNVKSLPSLGQLPSLRELSFEGLDVVSMIGSDFYGNKKPFPSLSTLKFKEMLAWKDWSPYAGGLEDGSPFSCLKHLVIQNCPSLVGTLPCRLEHLVKLEIQSCWHLNISTDAVCFPYLRELHLQDCHKEILKSLVNITSLTFLGIWNIAELVCFDHGFMSYLVELKKLHIRGCNELKYLWQGGNEMLNLTCLQELFIQECPQITSFVAEGGAIELPRNLERMELSHCTSLEQLPSKIHTLRHLTILSCPKLKGGTIPLDERNSNNVMSQFGCQLVSFPYVESRLTIDIRGCTGLESLEEIIVESLESLTIQRCENLKSLPWCLHTLPHLTHMQICDCPSLEIGDFPSLPITLSSLEIWKCSKIKSIVGCNIANCNNLTELHMYNCPTLEIEDFPPLPISLLCLTLEDCPKIKSIASCNIVSCNNLTHLKIFKCPSLEIEDFPPLPITLSSLWLGDCPKIKSLPNQWHHLTFLWEIHIYDCPSIKCFPKGGFPPNLRGLAIRRCENLKQPMREWGLPLLTSLQYLGIEGIGMEEEGDEVWFPLDADGWSLLFPSSLTKLHISEMRNVERLSSGLRNHLSSLQYLLIADCPKLRDLPEDGLPPSLQQLGIYRCKIPQDQCLKLAEEIPFVEINTLRIR